MFGPKSAQVNAVVEAVKETAPQLSVEPPSRSAATIEAAPVPSKNTVIS